MKRSILGLLIGFFLIPFFRSSPYANVTHYPPGKKPTDIDIYLPFVINVSEGANTVDFVSPFIVEPGPGGIFLAWTTHAEFDLAGFLMRRSQFNLGNYESWEYVPIIDLDSGAESTFIPSRGPLGADYNFFDANVETGVRYYYILEIIHIDNSREIVGAHSAIP